MQQHNTTTLNKEEDFLQQLRATTAKQHSELEATELSANLLKEDVTTDLYMKYLVHMRDVIAYMETKVFPMLTHLLPDIANRYKLPAIDSDIKELSRHVPEPIVKPLGDVKDCDTVAEAMGYMYVIEGSTLGGRMLLKHVRDTLGFDETKGGRFFAGYGADTGMMWKNFLAVLTGYVVAHGCEEEVIRGANQAFSIIEEHFS